MDQRLTLLVSGASRVLLEPGKLGSPELVAYPAYVIEIGSNFEGLYQLVRSTEHGSCKDPQVVGK